MVLNSKQVGFPLRLARMFVFDKENICKTCFASSEHTTWRYRMYRKIRRRVWNTKKKESPIHEVVLKCRKTPLHTSRRLQEHPSRFWFRPSRSSIWTVCAPNSITRAPPSCNTWPPKVCAARWSPVSWCASWPPRLLAEQMSNQSSSSSQVVPDRRRGSSPTAGAVQRVFLAVGTCFTAWSAVAPAQAGRWRLRGWCIGNTLVRFVCWQWESGLYQNVNIAIRLVVQINIFFG